MQGIVGNNPCLGDSYETSLFRKVLKKAVRSPRYHPGYWCNMRVNPVFLN